MRQWFGSRWPPLHFGEGDRGEKPVVSFDLSGLALPDLSGEVCYAGSGTNRRPLFLSCLPPAAIPKKTSSALSSGADDYMIKPSAA